MFLGVFDRFYIYKCIYGYFSFFNVFQYTMCSNFFHSLIFCKSQIIVNDPHTNTGALQSLTHHNCSWLTWLITDQIECVLKLIFDTLSPTSCITRLSKVEVLHQANIMLNFHSLIGALQCKICFHPYITEEFKKLSIFRDVYTSLIYQITYQFVKKNK